MNGALVLLGTLLGIPYVYLQYKASPKFWVASALNALPFIYVNFVQGNFATAGLFVYYLLVAVQAIFFKHEEVTEEGVFLIYTTPRRKYLPLLLISTLLLLLFYGFLSHVQQLFGTFLPWNFRGSAANSVARCLCHRLELHRNVAHFSQIYGALAHLDRRESGLCGDVCAATQLFLGWSLFPLSRDVCGGLAGVEKAPPATTGVSIAHGLVAILCTLFLTFLH